MTTSEQTESKGGRPRSEKARAAILRAAADLLLERGLDSVSMDAVAEQAGVSKATIYRWWPTKEALALDALYAEWAEATPASTETGSLRGDLLALLLPWVHQLAKRPYARVMGSFITRARSDPGFASAYVERLMVPRREIARAVLERARQRGELEPAVQIDVALDVLYGAVYHRFLHGHAPLTDQFVTDVVDTVLGGLACR
ncbi:MAG: TetR family transcriptional regulator [Marmoricola sp.]|nr:TetR family transcriptional regulator [Marmoricola sp.]